MAIVIGETSDPNTHGVLGISHNTASAVSGVNDFAPGPGLGGNGAAFESAEGEGVRGTAKNPSHAGVFGRNSAGGIGVFGESSPADGISVFGQSDEGIGVFGLTHGQFRNAVVGINDFSGAGPGKGGNGGAFESAEGEGVRGTCKNAIHAGVVGKNSAGGIAIFGESLKVGGVGAGVSGISTSASGVFGKSTSGAGVQGESTTLHGVSGISHNTKGAGVFGANDAGGLAASFIGAIQATGDVTCHHVACQDVFCFGGDIAEEFPIAGGTDGTAQPGTVMVLSDEGALKPSDTPYDDACGGRNRGRRGLSPRDSSR